MFVGTRKGAEVTGEMIIKVDITSLNVGLFLFGRKLKVGVLREDYEGRIFGGS